MREVLRAAAAALRPEIPRGKYRPLLAPLGKEISGAMEPRLTWELVLLEVVAEGLVPREQRAQVKLEEMAEAVCGTIFPG